jgi:hypothetical protein
MSIFPAVKLWLDDVRPPWKHGCIGWTWARSYAEAIAVLQTGKVTEASLDHDLTERRTLGIDDGSLTGLDVVRWMAANDVWPKNGVSVHSLNANGRAQMEAIIAGAHARQRQKSSAVITQFVVTPRRTG